MTAYFSRFAQRAFLQDFLAAGFHRSGGRVSDVLHVHPPRGSISYLDAIFLEDAHAILFGGPSRFARADEVIE